MLNTTLDNYCFVIIIKSTVACGKTYGGKTL